MFFSICNSILLTVNIFNHKEWNASYDLIPIPLRGQPSGNGGPNRNKFYHFYISGVKISVQPTGYVFLPIPPAVFLNIIYFSDVMEITRLFSFHKPYSPVHFAISSPLPLLLSTLFDSRHIYYQDLMISKNKKAIQKQECTNTCCSAWASVPLMFYLCGLALCCVCVCWCQNPKNEVRKYMVSRTVQRTRMSVIAYVG